MQLIAKPSRLHTHTHCNVQKHAPAFSLLERKASRGFKISMADKLISVEDIKAFWHSQFHDPDKWELNMKLLRAVGLFAGSIVLMRQYGDMMAI